MGCKKNRSRTWNSLLFTSVALVCLSWFEPADARFASQFSLTAGELYTDNIFFTENNKEHDFVTTITPSLSLLYAPEGQTIPTLNVNISPGAVIFARHPERNNFGENMSLNGAYTYQYSPRLNFHISEALGRQGRYRLGPLTQGEFQLPSPPTSPPPVGGTPPGQGNWNLSNYTSGSQSLRNAFSAQGTFLYQPDISFTGGYKNNFNYNFDQPGGNDVSHNFGIRGVYNWRQEHNLHAGYSISIYNTRNQGNNVVHNFDIGDDFFSNYQIQLSPTLTLAASTGASFNAGKNGPRVANNSNVTIVKIWQTATLSGSVRKGLTSTDGISGISDTTSVTAAFNMQLAETLSAISSVNFSLYDTDDGNFKTFQASIGTQYLINSWLSTNLFYNYRWVDSGNRVASVSNGLLKSGVVRANSIYWTLTAKFDVWPNIGLARGPTSSALSPLVRTPFLQSTPVLPVTNP